MSITANAMPGPQAYLQRQIRWHPLEIVFWLATLLPFYFFPSYLSLASQIAIAALFALSLDLILGYAGIVSLGHAAFFGIGAYTAGLFSKFVWGEPITGLILAALVAGLLGYAMSFIIAKFRHLTLIMITLGFGLLLLEAANSAHWLTGGADGLQGVNIWPLFGTFKFDLWGYTAYSYSLIVLFVMFLVARRLIHSPFGLALRGIRENSVRMPAIGAPSAVPHPQGLHHLRGDGRHRRRPDRADHLDRLAGSAQLRAFRRRSGDGRSGRRRPALWRHRRHHHLSGRARPVLRPQSAILVFLDRPAAGGRGDVPAERHSRRTGAADAVAAERVVTVPALSTSGLNKSFGSLGRGERYRDHPAAGRALCADRSERRRQDHADQPDDRHARARQRPHPARRPRHHPHDAAAAGQARPGAHLPDQYAVSRTQRA